MKKTVILFLAFFLLISNTSFGGNSFPQKPLIIFHIDLNSVSLRKDYIRKWLKKISEMGYNAVLWEVENEIKWEICPECVSPDAFSKEEFKELLNYSRKLGLQPIPLLQTIGHAEYVLQNEKYFSFREDPERYDCYCTSNNAVRDFIKRWINEYIELFGDIKYFHLGGDEAYVFGTCEKCLAVVGKIGKNGLYADYIKDISSELVDKGIRPGIWDDMIMKKPDEISLIPKDFVIWDWNYWDTDTIPSSVMLWSAGKRINKTEVTDEIKNAIPEILDGKGELHSFYVADFLHRNGFDVITCSSSRSHGDAVFTGRHNVHSGNIIAGAKKCDELNLLGTCVTSWAVRIANYEIQEQWLFLAPLTIKNPTLKKEELLSITSEKLFGVKGEEFYAAISDAGFPFPFSDQNTTGIMWTGMKDSKPAPPRYIKDLIEKWKKNKSWDSKTQLIPDALTKVGEGLYKLNRFIVKANNGYEILDAWFKGGSFQFWQAVIANDIVQKAEGRSTNKMNEMIDQINRLKKDYIFWANEWMTPKSADQNGGLIYDAVLNYFQEDNAE